MSVSGSVQDNKVESCVEMFKVVLLFAFLIGACYGDGQAEHFCSKMPNLFLKCLHNPKALVLEGCTNSTTECEKMTCHFRENGWFDGDIVNKLKVTQHFDNFTRDYPDWSPAVQQVKTACLTTDLFPQGVYLNCPAYDIMHCALTSFIKKAKPSQWSTLKECEPSRKYATECPVVCPNGCLDEFPAGACDACLF